MKNLDAEIAHHKGKDKKSHRHIDYLLTHQDVELSEVCFYLSEHKEECLYNQLLIKNGASTPVPCFNSSD